jgi:hypothetical protein
MYLMQESLTGMLPACCGIRRATTTSVNTITLMIMLAGLRRQISEKRKRPEKPGTTASWILVPEEREQVALLLMT